MSSNCLKFNALVLAAGLGVRMRPLTADIPKPLIKICNRPLIGNILSRISEAGAGRIAVNTHYLPEKVDEYIANSEFAGKVTLFHEPEILGTGGPAVNARELLTENEFFLLHNGDILCDVELEDMLRFHTDNACLVTMLTLDGPENKLKVMDDGNIVDILGRIEDEHPGGKMLTYGGVMILSRRIFEYLPSETCNCSIIPPVIEMIRQLPGKVKAFRPQVFYWNDLGTIERYFQAHKDILALKKCTLPYVGSETGTLLLNAEAELAPDSLYGFICAAKNSFVAPGAHVENCILLEGARIQAGEFHIGEIIGADFSVHRDIARLRDLNILKDMDLNSCEVSSLLEFGSSRGFYRITPQTGDCRVLLVSDASDEDFERFISIGSFLAEHRLFTPEIYKYDLAEYSVLMEDLGNTLLYDFFLEHGENEAVMYNKYCEVIDTLIEFQLRGSAALTAHPEREVRVFSREYLRWETEYFQKQFLMRHCRLPESLCHDLDAELEALADTVFAHPKVFMHRDFQSQNIMLHAGGVRFVDFQGARIGPVGYDIMSLLRDPYVNISAELRHKLLDYYFHKFIASPLNVYVHSVEDFKVYTALAGMQRNMQALGAYAFLSHEKGKMQYQKYIPQALIYLREGLDELRNGTCGIKLNALDSLINLR
jgi:NDP-sugar pyrophosphorylase family protein/aminoglycoside/choline kinase family phosphotransferase